MATENNNNNTIHANYFLKGMNSDTSSEFIDSQSYRYGLNIRVNSYTSIEEALNPNNTAGAVSPIQSGKRYEGIVLSGIQVLCTNSINNIGIVITADQPNEDGDKLWHIYRVVIENDKPIFTEICKNINNKYTKKNKFTTVITYDSEQSIKLFIADGEHPIISINIHGDNLEYLNGLTSVDQIIDRYLYPWEQASLYEKISGTLPVSIIQYSYRFFKKYGICSKISPLTKRFYTMNYTKDQEAGNKNGTSTNIGYRLRIPLIQDGVDFSKVFDHCQLFRIQQGGKTENTDSDTKDNKSDATDTKKSQENTSGLEENRDGAETPIKVFLVQEFQLPKDDDTLYVEDNGLIPLQELTLDEYATFTGESVTPQYIAYLQKNLFAGNIKDTTVIEDDSLFLKTHTFSCDYANHIYLYDPITKKETHGPIWDIIKQDDVLQKYYLPNDYDINTTWHGHIMLYDAEHPQKRIAGGSGKWVKWRFITAETPLWATDDDKKKYKGIYNGKINSRIKYITVRKDGNYFSNNGSDFSSATTDTVLSKGAPKDTLGHTNWQDPLYASMFRSLRRDDTYRYGIVYYTKYGQRTDVCWIADIKTPTLQEVPIAYTRNSTQYTISLGIEFEVTCDDPRFRYYQIVRCPKNKQWSKNMYQVVCARPMKHTTPSVLSSTETENGTTSTSAQEAGAGRYSPWLPNPYAIDQFMQYINTYWAKNNDWYDIWSGFYGSNQKCQKNTYLTSSGENYLVQMFSEDINVNEDSVYDALAGSNCWLQRAYTYNGLNYMNFNSSLNNYKTEVSGVERFIASNHNDYDLIYNYMDVKSRTRSSSFYTDYSWLMEGRYFPDTNGYEHDTRLSIGMHIGMKAVLDGGTGLALTPTRYWDTVFYDAEVTCLSQGTRCNSEKPSFSITHYYDKISDNSVYRAGNPRILAVAKAKEPSWEDGFSNITMEGADVKNGSKTYKGHTSFVGGNTFCNWVCSGMYDLRLSEKQSQYGVGVRYRHTNAGYVDAMGGSETLYGDGSYAGVFTALSGELYNKQVTRSLGACGWIGPGTRCIIAALDSMYRIERSPSDGFTWGCNDDFGLGDEDSDEVFRDKIYKQFHNDAENNFGIYSNLPAVTCSLTNIQHKASNYAGITRDQLQYDTYYSHGYWGRCNGEKLQVFDGDIFPTPVEITPIHKTYDFQSIGDTIPSVQVNQFVLAESNFNSFFDYGYNFRNTQSDNIQLDVAQITGVCSQDRPQYKQNMVFAENNITLESFTAANLEKSNDTFPVRIVYGTDDDTQTIDNRTLFKPNNYVDVGSEFGPITNIDAKENTLYFWQRHAFGKLAVNERSLVTDNNNNTIQLGQGGVLQRHDYINETYGMMDDVCNSIFAEGTLMWYDNSSRSVLGYQQQIIDLGSTIGIQNLINSKSVNNATHSIFYDVQNKEVSIDEFNIDGNQAQLIYNTNKIFPSFYTRKFDDCLTLDGVCYLINLKDDVITQINYITNNGSLLKPSVIEFVVNNIPQHTKVFDNQMINTIKRDYSPTFVDDFMKNKIFTFTTNMYDKTVVSKDNMDITDRECNIKYVIPRYQNAEYGNRMRGTWMNVRMEDNNPQKDYVISNIMTNTRLSIS